MPRKPYTIENQRPRRTISVYGRVLAPKGHGQNAQVDLDKEELLGAGCLKFLTSGRAKLVRGEAPAALVAALSQDEPAIEETVARVAAVSPEPEPVPEPDPKPVVEELPPEPEPSVVDDPGVELVEPDPLDHLEDLEWVWTEDDLFALNASEQKTICRSRELKVGGKEADRVQRILDDQAGD